MAVPVILVDASPRRADDGTVVPVALAGNGGNVAYPVGYRAGIKGLPTISAALDFADQEMGGGGVPQTTGINFAPGTAGVLAEIAGHYWPDAAITVRIGPEGAGTPPIALVGTVLEAPVQAGVLQIAIADPAAKLKLPILVDRFAGTGGLDGPTELAGVAKSRAWGRCFNVPAWPLDPANNVHCFGDPTRRWQAIDIVRDRGAQADAAALTPLAWAGSAAATLAALQAAVAPAGGGVLAPDIACVKWWAEPGDLTADIRGEMAGGYVETAAEIAQRIVAVRSALTFAAGTVAAAATLRPAVFGWRVADETTTAADALSAILGDVSTSWLLDGGVIVLRPWEWDAPTISARSFAVQRRETYRPIFTRKLGFRRNWHKVSRGDLADVVFASDIVLDDGTPLSQAIGDLSDPNVLTPKDKAALISRLRESDAWWNALATDYGSLAPQPSYDDARSVTYAAGVDKRLARTAFLLALEPAWDLLTEPSPVDHAGLRTVLAGVDTALARLDSALKSGAPGGTLVAGVPADKVAQAVILSLQDTAAIVAGGSLSPEAKTYITKELASAQERRDELMSRASTLSINTIALTTDYTGFAAYITSRPGWSDPNATTPVDATTYNNLRTALFATFALIEGQINARIAQGSSTAAQLVGGNGTIVIVGDAVSRTGTATGYQTVYSNRSTKGDAVAKAHLLATSALPAAFGFATKANATSLAVSSILAGFVVYLDGAGKRRVTKIVGGVASGDWNDGEQFAADVWLSLGYFESSSAGSVIYAVNSLDKPNEKLLTTSPGQELVWKALLVGGGAIDSIIFSAKEKQEYATIIGGPPANATAGANLVTASQVTATATRLADGRYEFDNSDYVVLTQFEDANQYKPVNGALAFDVNLAGLEKVGTVVGTAKFLMLFETANGPITRFLNLLDARTGRIDVPPGATRYYADESVVLTSGKIIMPLVTLTPVLSAANDVAAVTASVVQPNNISPNPSFAIPLTLYTSGMAQSRGPAGFKWFVLTGGSSFQAPALAVVAGARLPQPQGPDDLYWLTEGSGLNIPSLGGASRRFAASTAFQMTRGDAFVIEVIASNIAPAIVAMTAAALDSPARWLTLAADSDPDTQLATASADLTGTDLGEAPLAGVVYRHRWRFSFVAGDGGYVGFALVAPGGTDTSGRSGYETFDVYRTPAGSLDKLDPAAATKLGGIASGAGTVGIIDQNVQRPPSWYILNTPNQTVEETKNGFVLQVPSESGYFNGPVLVRTTIYFGLIGQTVTVGTADGAVHFERVGLYRTEAPLHDDWSGWKKSFSQAPGGLPSTADVTSLTGEQFGADSDIILLTPRGTPALGDVESIVIQAKSDGSFPAGTFPITRSVVMFIGGVNRTADATFVFTPSAGVTIEQDTTLGYVFRVTGMTASTGTIGFVGTYMVGTVQFRANGSVAVEKRVAPVLPPPTFNYAVDDTIAVNNDQDAFAVIAGPLTVTSSAAGAINFNASLTFERTLDETVPTSGGSFPATALYTKAQIFDGSGWIDLQAANTGAVTAENHYYDATPDDPYDQFQILHVTGVVANSAAATGLTANSNYQLRLLGRPQVLELRAPPRPAAHISSAAGTLTISTGS